MIKRMKNESQKRPWRANKKISPLQTQIKNYKHKESHLLNFSFDGTRPIPSPDKALSRSRESLRGLVRGAHGVHRIGSILLSVQVFSWSFEFHKPNSEFVARGLVLSQMSQRDVR